METIFIACAGSLIAAVVSLITLFTNRKWAKDDKADEIVSKLNDVENKLLAHIASDELHNVKTARSKIIRFADECRRGEQHSQEAFNNIMEDDINFYEDYCSDHPKFANNKATASIELINEVYKACLKDNTFI